MTCCFLTWSREDLITNSNCKAISPAQPTRPAEYGTEARCRRFTHLQRPQPRLTLKGWPGLSEPNTPLHHQGLSVTENGPYCARQVQGTGEGPEGQDGLGAGALACFLIILFVPTVGCNFKTIS